MHNSTMCIIIIVIVDGNVVDESACNIASLIDEGGDALCMDTWTNGGVSIKIECTYRRTDLILYSR